MPQGKRGKFTIPGNETPETDIWQKTHKKIWIQPYAGHDIYCASVTVGVCT